jgi:hypothetical protein
MRMPEWLNWLAAITGILGFFFSIPAYFRKRGTRKGSGAVKAEHANQLNYIRAIDATAKKADVYRERVW